MKQHHAQTRNVPAPHPEKAAPKPRVGPKGYPMLLRCLCLGLVFVLSAVALSLRLATLQIDEASEWEARASRQQLANIPIEPVRGNIYDSNMKLLAQSASVWTIEASPNALNQTRLKEHSAERDAAKVAAQELARILGLDYEVLYEKLSNTESMYYKVKSKIEKPLADEVREVCEYYGIGGIYFREDSKRYYPYENLASTILGFVGEDNNGLEGIERWYDEVLAGTAGRTVSVIDAWGNEIATGEEAATYAAEDGRSIVLTLNTDIQSSLEKHLASAVEEHNARERGFAIAMDVNTGAILGMAVYPSYDPNDPYTIQDAATQELLDLMIDGSEEKAQAQSEARTLQWRNKTLADTYEPGSVMKIITAAAALDSGTHTQESCFYCGGSLMVDGWDKPFSCAQGTAHGQESLREALIDSCNLSFIQMSAEMGLETWYSYLKAFGFTEPTGVDLPGEPSQSSINNLVYSLDRMGAVELASCSFGQSNKYTAVQMITAICAAINGGNLMQPYIVSKEIDSAGNVLKSYEPTVKRQVVSEETSAQLREILEELVSSGTSTGRNAYISGYRVGGKSGTSEKLEVMNATGRDDAYISSFVGFAPADDPQICVLLALDEAEDPAMGNYFGGRLAAPSVREILKDSLEILGVDPLYTDADAATRKPVKTPKATDNKLSYAQTLLNEAGLNYKVIGEGTEVLGQCPEAYSEIPAGGTVYLYADAAAVEHVQMPDLSGRSPQNAVELLRGMGLNVFTAGAPDDGAGVTVTAQSHEPGASLPVGTVVTLTLSTGQSSSNE